MSVPLIPVERVIPDPGNVRDDLGDLDELTASIRFLGILQPLVVRPDGKSRFVIVDGHRRYEAALRAGVDAVPCIASRAGGSGQVVELMLAYAMHKRLDPFEQAKAFGRLRDTGMTVALIAQRTGYSQATIRDRLALLALPPEARRAVADGHATIKEATTLARQVKATGTGSAALRPEAKARWFDRTHRLAPAVHAMCTHDQDRALVGGVGCGQCWERAIRDEVTGHNLPDAPPLRVLHDGDALVEDAEGLARTGESFGGALERLGVTQEALERALTRAQRWDVRKALMENGAAS